MSLSEVFRAAGRQGRAAFIPYVTGCHPDDDACLAMVRELDRAGADLIEVGIPFSDPLADGPTIQAAGQAALEAGATPAAVLELCARARSLTAAPLVVMTYVNPVLALGWRRFAGACADAGVAGVIIPDLPPEEAGPWRRAAAGAGLEPVFMAAPTTPPARVAEIARQGGGFLYYVSMTGVTGGQLRLDGAARRRLAGARRASGLPVAVGFGVARPEQARELAGLADGVVVGSALLRAHARGGMAGFAGLARGLRASLAR